MAGGADDALRRNAAGQVAAFELPTGTRGLVGEDVDVVVDRGGQASDELVVRDSDIVEVVQNDRRLTATENQLVVVDQLKMDAQ